MATDNVEIAIKSYTDEANKGLKNIGNNADKAGKKIEDNAKKVKQLSDFISTAFSLNEILPWVGIIKNVTNQMITLTKAQVN